jgi:integrase
VVSTGSQATGPALDSPGQPGLLAKLTAAVRPELRVEVFTVDPQDPIFGGPPCRVAGCERAARVRGICLGHYHRWKHQGCPDIDEFLATTPAVMRGYRPVQPCSVPGCDYGRRGAGLCCGHHTRWLKEGKPPLPGWLAAQPEVRDTRMPRCRVSFCDLWAEGTTELCQSHGARWRHARRPAIGDFVRACDETVPGHERFHFGQLAAHLRLEVQYAVQQRRDEARVRTPPRHVQHLITAVAGSGVHSLLDWPAQRWLNYGPLSHDGASAARSLVIYARRQVEDLHYGRGWDVEYPRDVWRLQNLGITAGHAHVRFDRIPQRWLRELAKRWARWQLGTGLSTGQVVASAAAVARLGAFLAQPGVGVETADQISRQVIERYLAELAATVGHTRIQGKVISLTSTFFQAVRQHRWAELPAGAVFYPEDYPKRPEQLPRALAEHVMAQIEDPANLARWHDPAARLVTVILIRCGLRVGDAVALPRDCIVHDADGAPYLRYFNHKMKREALVPIDEHVESEIGVQHQRVLSRWPDGSCPHLFPGQKANLNGRRHFHASTYRSRLKQWLESCDIRDAHGQPVVLKPHQWRHTLGTRLLNNDVPQEVVRRILDHDSHTMTAHYANPRELHWAGEKPQVARSCPCRNRASEQRAAAA